MNDLCYIGRTTNPKSRFSTHKCKAQTSNIPLYKHIRENGGWEKFKVEVIDVQEFQDGDDARQHEHNLFIQHNANLNTLIPNGNPKAVSYYQQNKEHLRIVAREKYKKTKTEWKYPKKTTEQMKTIHLNKIKRTGCIPTSLSKEKHKITQDEIDLALAKFHKP
tara:strand:+ start:1867 stop:2355 length:489 start_codon:yes stop_codon:yes gene_type:complete